MGMDVSSLFQPTPYPVHPIAQLLQAFAQARLMKRRLDEERDAAARNRELYGLQVAREKQAQAQAAEQARVDAMPAEQFASSQGLRYLGVPGRTIGELRRAGQLATAFERAPDPWERLGRLTALQQAVPGLSEMAIPVELQQAIEQNLGGAQIFPRRVTGFTPAAPEASPAPGQGLGAVPISDLQTGLAPVPLGRPVTEPVVATPLGPLPMSQAVRAFGPEGVRALAGVTAPPSPAEQRLAQQGAEAAARQKGLDFAKQLHEKMLAAVRANDRARAQRVAAQFDQLGGRYGIPDGVTAFIAAQKQVRDEQATEAARTLREAQIQAQIDRTRRPGPGGEQLTAVQRTAVTQYNAFTGRQDRLASQIDRLNSNIMLDETTKASRIKQLEDEIARIERAKAAVLKRSPGIAPFVGAVTEEAQPGAGEASPVGGGKILTRDQLRVIARKYGVSEAEAERQARAQGYMVAPPPSAGPQPAITLQQAFALVDQAARQGRPFPEADLRRTRVPEYAIGLLRQRYQRARP
jgi:hypothetical protein